MSDLKASGIVIRDLAGMAEFHAAEVLQRAVWGEGDVVDPGDLMMVIQAEGGLVAGAFRGGQMLGYVFGFPTREPSVQHSHRLAVLAEARGMGLALALKWHQRDWCLARGITLVRWTFDPLRHTNANLNIARLGGRSSIYSADHYGAMAGINKGAPSDRLLVDWSLDAPHVAALRQGQRHELPLGLERIAVPADFGAMLAADPAAALAQRLRLRERFQHHFAQGQQVCGYDPATHAYLLSPLAGTPAPG
ncbi:GNAT family N-acetyltransferase [Tabrizicola sp.]|uniref:GNAT family N-acetyltransferase n=1 Tax=Tabrizicola sp. TaxID=2005166 RepID=UPI00286A7193|nr:GNAT family N-acetyltransferase [Tabrizicola sp.]